MCVRVCARSFACTVFLGMCGCRYQTSDVVAHAKDSIREVRQYEVYYSAAALLEFHWLSRALCWEDRCNLFIYPWKKKIIQKLKVLRPPILFSFPFTLSLLPFTKKVKQCNPTDVSQLFLPSCSFSSSLSIRQLIWFAGLVFLCLQLGKR